MTNFPSINPRASILGAFQTRMDARGFLFPQMNKQQQWKQLDDESKAITAKFAKASKSEQRQLFVKLQEIVTTRNALGVNPPIRFAR